MTKKLTKAPNRDNAQLLTAPREPTEKAVTKPYEPTPEERATINAMFAREKELPVAPCVKLSEQVDGVTELAFEHEDQNIAKFLLMGATGTVYESFCDGLLQQLANASAKDGKFSEDDLNFMLAVIKGIEPRDQVESMLAAQMAAIHMMTMIFAGRLARAETLPQQDSAERAFNKLARTFVAQVEALRRHRTGGEQKVTVEHVTVNEGGQAIVGNVAHVPGGGRADKNSRTTP